MGGCCCGPRIPKRAALFIGEDGRHRLPVVSDGTGGPDWIERLRDQSFSVMVSAEGLLRSVDFQSVGPDGSQAVVLKMPEQLLGRWSLKAARDLAEQLGFSTPQPEVACLMREQVSDDDVRDMGLRCMLVAHQPMFDAQTSVFGLLGLDRYFIRCLSAERNLTRDSYDSDVGFVFMG
jgi:hypothetical protein